MVKNHLGDSCYFEIEDFWLKACAGQVAYKKKII